MDLIPRTNGDLVNNLDDRSTYLESDPSGLHERLQPLPDQCKKAWVLTLEEGDLEQENGPADGSGKVSEASGAYGRRGGTDAASRVYRKIADAPASYLPLLEKVVEDILDGLRTARR